MPRSGDGAPNSSNEASDAGTYNSSGNLSTGITSGEKLDSLPVGVALPNLTGSNLDKISLTLRESAILFSPM